MYKSHPNKAIDRTFVAYNVTRCLSGEGIKKAKVLSMPSPEWNGEKMLRTVFHQCGIKGEFHGIERDPSVFAEVQETARSYIDFFVPSKPVTLSEHITTTNELYDVIVADYLGPWGKSKVRDMIKIFASDTGQHLTTLITTFSMARHDSFVLQSASTISDAALPIIVRNMEPTYMQKIKGAIAGVTYASLQGSVPCIAVDAHTYPGRSGAPYATVTFACNNAARSLGHDLGRFNG